MLLPLVLSLFTSAAFATPVVSAPSAIPSSLASNITNSVPNNVADLLTKPINVVTIGNKNYTYHQLVGNGLFPSDARDQFGDTAGGWGSAIAADVKTWLPNPDGSYSGIIYTLPDRGWNTNGRTF
jgi:hypothetical protein